MNPLTKIKPWEYWRGQRVERIDDGVVYIATASGFEWQYRLRIWKENLGECPVPMPEHHLVFNVPKGYRKVV